MVRMSIAVYVTERMNGYFSTELADAFRLPKHVEGQLFTELPPSSRTTRASRCSWRPTSMRGSPTSTPPSLGVERARTS